jgi:hypothetical protein
MSGMVVVILGASDSYAAIPKNLPSQSLQNFLPEGSFRGGGAGTGFSLLGVKRVYSTDRKSERLIFEIGDKEGKPYSGKPGYFHAQLFKNPSEFSLDFSQLVRSHVSSDQVRSLVKNSKLIDRINLVTDKEDHSTNLFMRFKSPVTMRMFILSPKKKSPKLVVDIRKI